MKLIILGPPGSGKGTMSKMLEEEYKLYHLSAGDLLRDQINKDTIIGRDIKKFIEKGKLVPNHIMSEMIKLDLMDKNKFLLDGYPRTLEQADDIKDTPIDKVIFLNVSLDKVTQRLSQRRMDPVTRKIYHLTFVPPPNEIKDRLIQRKDDNPTAIKQRYEIYQNETHPVVEHYRKLGKLIEIDGEPLPDPVYKDIKEKLIQLGLK
jgi:adenylate kinase